MSYHLDALGQPSGVLLIGARLHVSFRPIPRDRNDGSPEVATPCRPAVQEFSTGNHKLGSCLLLGICWVYMKPNMSSKHIFHRKVLKKVSNDVHKMFSKMFSKIFSKMLGFKYNMFKSYFSYKLLQGINQLDSKGRIEQVLRAARSFGHVAIVGRHNMVIDDH